MNFRTLILSIVLLASGMAVAQAQPNYFWNGGSGSFTNSNNWTFGVTSPAGPPGAGDRALFLGGSGFTVTGNGSPAQVIVQVELATFTGVIAPQGNVVGFPSLTTGFEVGTTAIGTAIFSGAGARLNSARPISVGGSSAGNLIFNGGSRGNATYLDTSASVSIAANPAGVGSMILTQASEFTATGTFNVGARGFGTLTITGGSSLNTSGIESLNQAGLNIGGASAGATGAQGTLNIHLDSIVNNELQTNIGLYGKGTVNITSGEFTSTDGGTDNPAISIARFAGSEGHLNVSGTGHVISDGELIVGGGGVGTMTITDDGLVETFARLAVPAIVGFGSDAEGLVTVDGEHAQWSITDALVVGQLGTGEVRITDGGTVFVEATDLEQIAPYLHIGDDTGSDGLIVITGEQSFLDASLIRTRIGVDAFSAGRLQIEAEGVANLSRTSIGSGGSGELRIKTGGELNTGTAIIGELATSTGTASIESGGAWHVGGQLYVGDLGNAELVVHDSATLTVDEFISIGENTGSLGTMTISGPVATVNGTLSAMYIGYLGEGELYLENAATWTLNGDVTLGEIDGGMGSAFVDSNSHWTVTGGIYAGGSGDASGGFGYLEALGAITSETEVIVWDNAFAVLIDGGTIEAPVFTLHGQLAGGGTIGAASALNSGLITPDDGVSGIGELRFIGNYMQTLDGELRIDIAGTTSGTEFDVLSIAGDAILDGQLTVSFLEDYVPTLDDEFLIIEMGGSITGSFSGLGEGGFVTTRGGIDVLISYVGGNGNDVVLYTEASPSLEGDYNRDGIVDAADYTVWRDSVGTNNLLADGDFDLDVDRGDLLVWRDHFGEIAGPGAIAPGNVPEPTSVVLAMLTIVTVYSVRRGTAFY